MSSDEDVELDEQESPPLSCHIVATEQHDGAGSFTVYVARLRLGRLEWTIRRRFREFRVLDAELRTLKIRPAVRLPRRQLMGSTTEHTVQRRRQRLSRYIVSSYEASRAQTALGGSYNSVGATPSTARLREEQARVLQRRGRSPSPDKDTVHSGHAQVGTGAPSGRAASPSPDPARPADDAGDSAPRQGEAAAGDSNSLDPIPDGGGDGPVETAKLLRRLCDLPMCLAGFLAVPHLMAQTLLGSEHEGNDPLFSLATTRLALKDEQRRSSELEARASAAEEEVELLRDEVARLREAAGSAAADVPATSVDEQMRE